MSVPDLQCSRTNWKKILHKIAFDVYSLMVDRSSKLSAIHKLEKQLNWFMEHLLEIRFDENVKSIKEKQQLMSAVVVGRHLQFINMMLCLNKSSYRSHKVLLQKISCLPRVRSRGCHSLSQSMGEKQIYMWASL